MAKYAGKQPTIKDINRILFSKANKVDQFLDDIKTTGGDVNKAKQLVKIFNDLSDDPVGKIVKRQREVGLPVGANKSAIFDRLLARLTSERYKKGVANLMVDKNWPEKVSAIMKAPTNLEKKSRAVQLLLDLSTPTVRAGALGVANENQ